MKAVILAGGLGTRFREETDVKPKPMIQIGGRPILWHIMRSYLAHGIDDFIICCGYRGYVIKEYFANYRLHMADVTHDFRSGEQTVHADSVEPWRVTVVDTGDESMTGGRLRRVREHLGDETFCFTYGDGVGDIDISESIRFHREHGREATVTAVQPPGRFGSLSLDGTSVTGFDEKPHGDGSWINGGFFVLEPSVIDNVESDSTIWEQEPMRALAERDQLRAFFHHGFWMPMDTLRDKLKLEELWESGTAPWSVP